MSLARFKRPLVVTNAKESVARAAQTMRDKGVGCLLVIKDGHPYGIVTDRDLVVRVLAEGLDASAPVGDFTTFGPLTVSIHDEIATAARRMREHGVRRLPIIDDSGGAVGIVTADDLLIMLGRDLASVCEGIENRSDSTDSRGPDEAARGDVRGVCSSRASENMRRSRGLALRRLASRSASRKFSGIAGLADPAQREPKANGPSNVPTRS